MDTNSLDLQFFPTGRALAEHAFAKFQRPIRRLLEPSAGRGDLLAPTGLSPEDDARHRSWSQRRVPINQIDCIEIDLTNHPILAKEGYRVVGHDFLKYEGAAIYSSIFMNPPFSAGAEHVLHAWNLLYSGELVAILNSQTLKNLCTKKRQLLAQLVAQHSATPPEYLANAFTQPDTQRTTEVEIVIIHLEKVADFKADFIDGLAKDQRPEATREDFDSHTEVMVPKSWVANQVMALKLATQALREAAIADVRASYYARMLGKSLSDTGGDDDGADPEATAAKRINEGYIKLQESAWTSVLRSADVTSRLSSAAQRRLEADFAQICQLEFTVQNVYGFLGGLIAKQGDIQLEMLCDVFDAFSAHHHENRVYFQGWKSNSKHRTCGMSLKASRIVLPACRRDHYADGYVRDLAWDDRQRMADIDKVFAMLDGKTAESTFGLVALFTQQMDALRHGERCSSDYFDARMYRGTGTFHLYPRNKKLVDRLNRLVGKQRAWLPPDDAPVPPGFWEQFSQAEKINRAADFSRVNAWRLQHGEERERAVAVEALTVELQKATAKFGIDYDPDHLIADETVRPKLPLLKAA